MIDKRKIEKAVQMILEAIGEDPSRPGLRDTPKRIADMYEEIFSGYNENDDTIYFEERADVVLCKNIKFYSMCEHHILPFYGTVDVAYVPNKKIAGISKIVRIVQKYSRRLQIQERLTNQIADEIYREYDPDGVIVITRAKHMCMIIRGVKNPATMISVTYRGVFETDKDLLNRVLLLLSQKAIFHDTDILG
ncbi:MAG: GTP cyclohydrolase I FolE [Candidatus Njordarchaeota archaeon]